MSATPYNHSQAHKLQSRDTECIQQKICIITWDSTELAEWPLCLGKAKQIKLKSSRFKIKLPSNYLWKSF